MRRSPFAHLALLALVLSACGNENEGAVPPPVTPPPPPPPITSAEPTPTPALPVLPGRTSKKSIIIQSRPSGESTLRYGADGSVDNHYEEHENGRGSEVNAKVRFATDGTLASFDATGHETMGTPIDEHFTLTAKHAKWKSAAESGEKDVDGPVFYMPLAPTIESLGWLARALKNNGGKIALLPDGTARLEKTGDYQLPKQPGDANVHTITSYAIYGISFEPTRVWLDEKDDLFAYVDAWTSCVSSTSTSELPALLDLQKKLDAARDEDIQKRLAHKPPPEGLAIQHARVLDVVKGKWLEDTTVVIKGDKITAVGPSKRIKAPKGAELVDAQGKALVPGLWDMHSHLGASDGVLDLAAGVTTARDVGNDPDRLDAFKEAWDSGRTAGPHVVRAGFIEGRGDKAAGAKITAETEEEAKAAVAFYKNRGYEQIKIYNSMKPELVPVLAQAAHEAGMRVSGHIPVHMRAEEAIRAGYDEVNHVNMLFLNFFIDKDTDTRTPLRFTIVADRAPELDLYGKPAKDFFKLMKDRKTTVDPTVGAFEDLFLDRVGQYAPGIKSEAARLPVQVRRQYLRGGLPVPEGKDARYKESFQALLKMVKALHDNGIPIAAGTDSLAGFMLHRELELYVAAGLTPAEAIASATVVPARIMKKDKTTGTIAPGMDADMAFISGDPLARIEDIRKVSRTIRGGVVYKTTSLYQEVGVLPAQGM